MDESLQLLPVVETLDLSRNKFAKIDNLRKCTKLKHLDLGFNHLRTITSFSEVRITSRITELCLIWSLKLIFVGESLDLILCGFCFIFHRYLVYAVVCYLGIGQGLMFVFCWIMQVSCHIIKLVLRNNALTSLHGIENLKSLEDLDVSYNIISNFTELEFLSGLSSLQRLWLEGNPLCCSRWYRAQVYSYFTYPEKVNHCLYILFTCLSCSVPTFAMITFASYRSVWGSLKNFFLRVLFVELNRESIIFEVWAA